MWNVLKFFFVWFWLAVVVLLVGLFFLGQAHPDVVREAGRVRHSAPPDPGAVLVVALPFVMCIPAYFISRPKRA